MTVSGKISVFVISGLMAMLLLFASGCATPSSMSSSVQYNGPISNRKLSRAIHVEKAAESRPNGGESNIGIGFITFIPAVPYGPQTFTPERYFANAAMMQYDFREDLAQTVVKDLTAAGLAQTVGYDAFGNSIGSQSEGVYRLQLGLKEGVWHRNFTMYGCSFMGVYLWFLGAPISYGHADIAFEARVIAPDGNEIGRRTFAGQMPLIESAYCPHQFPKRLPLIYQQISPEFRRFVKDCLERSPVETGNDNSAGKPPEEQKPQGSLVERLEKLKLLKETGVITEEEYQQKRKKLVDEI